MNKPLSLLLFLLASMALATGCDAPQPKHAPKSPARAPNLEPIRTPAPLPAQLGYHRYQGTVGGRPVIVELTVTIPDFPAPDFPADYRNSECVGQYYDLRSGVVYYLGSDGLFWPNHPLELVGGQDSGATASHWCAAQPLGPSLSGTCEPGGGRASVPFHLRESYAGAVRYEVLREELRGRVGRNYFGDPDSSVITLEYLHLLGPDTARPALARLQCPGPAPAGPPGAVGRAHAHARRPGRRVRPVHWGHAQRSRHPLLLSGPDRISGDEALQ